MSRIVEALEAVDVAGVAAMTVEAHNGNRKRRCQKCTDDGCDLLAWAQDIVERASTNLAGFRREVATW